MKADTQLQATSFLVFFGYMVMGVVTYQAITAIIDGLLHYLLFIWIYVLLVICSATFGSALGIAFKRVCNEKQDKKRKDKQVIRKWT